MTTSCRFTWFALYRVTDGHIKTYGILTSQRMFAHLNKQMERDPDLRLLVEVPGHIKNIKRKKVVNDQIVDLDPDEKTDSEKEAEKSRKILDKIVDMAIKELEKEGEIL